MEEIFEILETYENLNDQEYQILINDDNVEVVSEKEYVDGKAYEELEELKKLLKEQGQTLDDPTPKLHSLVIKRTYLQSQGKKLTKTIQFPQRYPYSSEFDKSKFHCKNFESQNIFYFQPELILDVYRIEYYDYYDKKDKLLEFKDIKKVLKVNPSDHHMGFRSKVSIEMSKPIISVHKIFIINDIYCFIMVSYNSSSFKNFVCYNGNLGVKEIPEINFWGKKTGKLKTEYITFENGIKRDWIP